MSISSDGLVDFFNELQVLIAVSSEKLESAKKRIGTWTNYDDKNCTIKP